MSDRQWLDADALDDAPLTADRRRFEGGVRELQEPRSRVRCWIVHGLPAERKLPANDLRNGITERIRAFVAKSGRMNPHLTPGKVFTEPTSSDER